MFVVHLGFEEPIIGYLNVLQQSCFVLTIGTLNFCQLGKMTDLEIFLNTFYANYSNCYDKIMFYIVDKSSTKTEVWKSAMKLGSMHL